MLKRIKSFAAAGAVALSAMATAATPLLAPITAAAGELTQNNFAQGQGLPWHMNFTRPAEAVYSIVPDGANSYFELTITNPGGGVRGGESRWDLQLRHRGLPIKPSTSYTVEFEMWTSATGHFATKVGDTSGAREYWNNIGTNGQGGGSDWASTVEVTQANTWKKYGPITWQPRTDAGSGLPAGGDNEGEWAFHMGGKGIYNDTDCFAAGTTIRFRNMSLKSSNSDAFVPEPVYTPNAIRANQIGYYPGAAKKATYAGSGATTFTIVQGATTVYTGTPTAAIADDDSGETVQILDFTNFTDEGTGYVLKCGSAQSYPFNISSKLYEDWKGNNLLKDSFNYFYLNRAGVDLQAAYVVADRPDDGAKAVTKAQLARKAKYGPKYTGGENAWGTWDPTNDIANLRPFYNYEGTYGEVAIPDAQNVKQPKNGGVNTGAASVKTKNGWYDAGDYGKYTVNGGVAAWQLMNLYELCKKRGGEYATLMAGLDAQVPNAGASKPALLEEAKWEMDFLEDMVVASGDYAGLAYHKIADLKWTDLGFMPGQYGVTGQSSEGNDNQRTVKPPTLAATLNVAGTAAQAARLWKPIDSTLAGNYEALAIKTFNAAKAWYAPYNKSAHPGSIAKGTNANALYAPFDDDASGGPYGDNDVTDEFYWAAAELWAATGSKQYMTEALALEGVAKHYLAVYSRLWGGEDKGTVTAYNWGNLATCGTVSLFLNQTELLTPAEIETVRKNFSDAGADYVAIQAAQGYGIPYKGAAITDTTDPYYEAFQGNYKEPYTWASNSMVINNATLLAYAYDATGTAEFLNGAITAMDYIMGRNPNDVSYVTFWGTHATERVHHRFWSASVRTPIESSPGTWAPRGVLSGGPNSFMQDPWIRSNGAKPGSIPPQKCYLDHPDSWSTNECTINWNAPLVWLAAYVNIEAPKLEIETGLVVNPKTVSVAVGSTATVSASEAVTAGGNNAAVATVTVSGTTVTITGVSAGSTTVTLTGASGTATVTITVTGGAAETSTVTGPPQQSSTPGGSTPSNETTPIVAANYIWGDVDESGDVEIGDIVLINKFLVGRLTSFKADYPKGWIQAHTRILNDVDPAMADSLQIVKHVCGAIPRESLKPSNV